MRGRGCLHGAERSWGDTDGSAYYRHISSGALNLAVASPSHYGVDEATCEKEDGEKERRREWRGETRQKESKDPNDDRWGKMKKSARPPHPPYPCVLSTFPCEGELACAMINENLRRRNRHSSVSHRAGLPPSYFESRSQWPYITKLYQICTAHCKTIARCNWRVCMCQFSLRINYKIVFRAFLSCHISRFS